MQDGQVASVHHADVAEWQALVMLSGKLVNRNSRNFTKLASYWSYVDDVSLVVEVVALRRDGGLIGNS